MKKQVEQKLREEKMAVQFSDRGIERIGNGHLLYFKIPQEELVVKVYEYDSYINVTYKKSVEAIQGLKVLMGCELRSRDRVYDFEIKTIAKNITKKWCGRVDTLVSVLFLSLITNIVFVMGVWMYKTFDVNASIVIIAYVAVYIGMIVFTIEPFIKLLIKLESVIGNKINNIVESRVRKKLFKEGGTIERRN